jgi:hypothetical protein
MAPRRRKELDRIEGAQRTGRGRKEKEKEKSSAGDGDEEEKTLIPAKRFHTARTRTLSPKTHKMSREFLVSGQNSVSNNRFLRAPVL